MGIRRYTTPTQELKVMGIDLTSFDVYVTYKQGHIRATFSGDDVHVSYDGTDTVIRVSFSQEESAKFEDKKPAEVQVNWFVNGKRNATCIKETLILRNLLEEVINDE